jgi:hypothetical protein
MIKKKGNSGTVLKEFRGRFLRKSFSKEAFLLRTVPEPQEPSPELLFSQRTISESALFGT